MRTIRLLLGLVLSWALLVTSSPNSPVAVAAPPTPKSAVAQAGKRNSLGELTAPDEVSARQIAKLLQERVEVVGARSEFSSTWALPDGTMASGVAAGPVWVRNGGDGTELEDWSEVDVDLVQDPDGSLRPKGHPSRVRLSGGSSEPVEELVTIADRGDAESVIVLGWGRSLPKPSIDGPRATYANVLAGVDLVLEVTRTGVEQYLVVKERPADAGVLDLSVPVRARPC